MVKTKVLITVKTYPSLSVKYDELVCTAGFTEQGNWIRIYPIPFRKKSYEQRYKKYDWIEIDLVKNQEDKRPESYRPASINAEIKRIGHLDTSNNWKERKQICLKKVYTNMKQLIGEAKNPSICTSLAVFKPRQIIDFTFEPVEPEWDKEKLNQILAKRSQLDMFEAEDIQEFNLVNKLPYKFYYHFKDENGKKSKLMVEDWELGMLYWNCLEKSKGDKEKALEKVKQKCFEEFVETKDLYFFLGTTKAYHWKARNPFIIVGLFYPKLNEEASDRPTLF
ncbi:MAG: hypothetical protein NZ519_11125 [Bacteroidia bacterium]|nr:hypothetical protein [Bacteroidia bacterium]MDW8346125.1 hypothetical protein [Bacteroidia bacterium]